MEFHFQLVPLTEVTPWGRRRKSLHWLGLTDGYFWVEVVGQELFRYTQAVLDYWVQENAAFQPDLPYENYHVARYWEDLLEMLPAVLDPVPEDLAQRVADQDMWSEWQERAEDWMERQESEAAWDVYYAALQWWGARKWSCFHLSKPPRIWLWRVGEEVRVHWDNRDATRDGVPVWEAERGETAMPAREFEDAVADFHARLMAAMAERVAEARRDWPFPDVAIDLDWLEREQRDRATWLGNALSRRSRTHEWDQVREALARIGAEIG